jgi:hypothetical protein
MAYTTINKSTDYFNTKLWNGNSSTQAITGVGFSPDLVWGKQRTSTENHQLLDVIRGANNILVSNNDTGNTPDTNILNSFDSDGFTLGNQNQLNDTGATYVSWNWKANGQGSSNTDGSINTTYTSANTTSGFSISTYTGTGANATVGHGLGATPKMFIVKRLNSTGAFRTYVEPLGNLGQLALNATDQVSDVASMWNSTSPTNSTISIGTHAGVNASGGTYVAYCFASVQGFSKIGSYVGNGQGNANGTFVYTGFKPAFVLIKNADFASNWNNFTGKIPGYNQINDILQPNLNSAENGTFAFDMLSNGFKHRSGDVMDRNGDTHIYMAFAEAPLVGTNNVPANAR